MTTPDFAARLRPLVEANGTAAAAQLCGVTPRSLQLWMRGDTPCAAMQAGVLLLLSGAARATRPSTCRAGKTPSPATIWRGCSRSPGRGTRSRRYE